MVFGWGELCRATAQTGRRGAIVVVAAILVAMTGCGFREPAIQPITIERLRRVEIPPIFHKTANMDILDVDNAAKRLYVTDGVDLGIDVIDLSTAPGRYLKTIRIGVIPNGVVVAHDIHKVFAGSDESALIVIDTDPAHPSTVDRMIANVPVKADGASDLIEYDPQHHKVFLTNPDDGFITVFDAATNEEIDKIRDLGIIDQPRFNAADGMLYVSGAERNTIIKIDPRTDKVVESSRIPLTCEPHGLAVDPKTDLGIVGCSDKDEERTLAWNFRTNRMVRSFDQAGAGDQVTFDPVSRHFYFAASSYSPAEVAVFDSGRSISFITGVPTSHHSKGVAYDEAHRWIYTYDGKHREAGMWGFPDPASSRPAAGHEASATPAAPKSDSSHTVSVGGGS